MFPGRGLILWGVFALNATAAWAAPSEQPELSSDSPIEFDAERKTVRASGNATFTHKGLTVTADEIEFFRVENRAEATGNVRVSFLNYRLVGRGLAYDLDPQELTSDSFRLGSPPLYILGTELSGNRETLVARDLVVYLHEPSPFALNARAAKATLFPGDRIEAEKVTFRIGKFPIFYLNHLARSIERAPITLGGRVGYRGNLGAYILLCPFFRIPEIAARTRTISSRTSARV